MELGVCLGIVWGVCGVLYWSAFDAIWRIVRNERRNG